MKILSYVQAREVVLPQLTEREITTVLTVSGRAEPWIVPVARALHAHAEATEPELVEASGMGRALLRQVPQTEWVYLVNPSMAPETSFVVREQLVRDGELFSPALAAWLGKQEIGVLYRLAGPMTREEARVLDFLWQQQETIVEREALAQTIWGESWTEQYSDWALDALISRLRKKLDGRWQIVTIKGRGYMLALAERPTQAVRRILGRGELPLAIPDSIYPTDEYLQYMNDRSRPRKVYADLLTALAQEHLLPTTFKAQQILAVNSYSYDNVDALTAWVRERGWQGASVVFSHYDPRAIELHQARIQELDVASWVASWHDDLRESKIKDRSMDLIVNDFRLNFNQNDAQNRAMLKHMYRILRPGGVALVSTVVDARYEQPRYGQDQERAPLNVHRPGTFQADEHLLRRCWSVPYYRQLFAKSGFTHITEFDVAEGRRWGAGSVTLTTDPWTGPYYRRWMVTK